LIGLVVRSILSFFSESFFSPVSFITSRWLGFSKQGVLFILVLVCDRPVSRCSTTGAIFSFPVLGFFPVSFPPKSRWPRPLFSTTSFYQSAILRVLLFWYKFFFLFFFAGTWFWTVEPFGAITFASVLPPNGYLAFSLVCSFYARSGSLMGFLFGVWVFDDIRILFPRSSHVLYLGCRSRGYGPLFFFFSPQLFSA